MDAVGNQEARAEIARIKVVVPPLEAERAGHPYWSTEAVGFGVIR